MVTTAPDEELAASVHQPTRRASREFLLAFGAFALFTLLVLVRATTMLEPDDFAYRASIVALRHGHILLSNAQYLTLEHQLASTGGQGILQWHHLASGQWISEKNPGYPFFAVGFYALGLLRVAPLFYGALACVGLYAGARAWLGRWAGTYAVWLYCFSGAALTFAWRDTMPSFADASLIAAGAGALVWVMLRPGASARHRGVVGLGAFLALEGAAFIRYTNVVELLVAVVAVIAFRRVADLSWRLVGLWLTSGALFAAGVASFNAWAYGSMTSSGYSAGEISFSLSSLWPNLRHMPRYLTTSMPLWLFAAAALVVIAVRSTRARRRDDAHQRGLARRDLAVAVVLGVGWLTLWSLYLTYTWTASQFAHQGVGPGLGAGPGVAALTVHVIRFYLPALGIITLLATWLLVRAPRAVACTLIAALFVGALWSYQSMTSAKGVPSNGVPATGQLPGVGPGGPGPNAPSGAGPPGTGP